MPVLPDEFVFQADGFIAEDPGLTIRNEARRLLASRSWSTPSVFFGDQPEPDSGSGPLWSITFNLGLDHLPAGGDRWFDDVEAIVDFITGLSKRLDAEFVLEVRSSSKLWWSLTVAIVDGEKPDLAVVRTMVENVRPR